MTREPLPPLEDGRFVVDLIQDYGEPAYYVRATAKRRPPFPCIGRYTVSPELFLAWGFATDALGHALTALERDQIAIANSSKPHPSED